MKLIHLIFKFFQKVKSEGIKETLKNFIYFNRVMVAIEKDLITKDSILDDSMEVIFLNQQNYTDYHDVCNLRSVEYYVKRGVQCCMLIRNNQCVGYQTWTVDSDFKDLKNLDITLKSDEAYEIELFVYPEYRGGDINKILSIETDNFLISKGIHKIYGFYYLDNIKALWWHRAYLKCREIKRVKIHRILLFEMANGRITVNL